MTKTIQAGDGKQYRLAYRPVEMGCVAMVTGHKHKCNEGRLVRAIIPLQPGERYGHAQRQAPTGDNQYWQIGALDGALLEYTHGKGTIRKQDITVAVRQSMLRRLKEIDNDQAT